MEEPTQGITRKRGEGVSYMLHYDTPSGYEDTVFQTVLASVLEVTILSLKNVQFFKQWYEYVDPVFGDDRCLC